jgi:hypothetical protein
VNVRVGVLGCVLLGGSQFALAADVSHQLTPYLWGSGLSGVVGAAGASVNVDASFSDILSNLDLGLMATYRADIGDWVVVGDAMRIELEGKAHGPGGLVESRVDVDETIIELDVGRKLTPNLAVIAGLRYVDMSSDAATSGPLGNTVRVGTDESWVDPVVGVLYTTSLAEKVVATVRADVGGFGVGSDFAWQFVGAIGYQWSPKLSFDIAYRYLDMDYDEGSGAGRFQYDAEMTGPAAGVTFRW